MSLNIFPRKSLARRLSEVCLGAAFTLVVGSYAQEARAQWLVHDVGSATAAAAEYGTQAERWAERMKQWAVTAQQYKDQFDFLQSEYKKLETFNFQLFATTNQFKRIPDDYGVTDECPGVSGGLAGDITSALTSFLPDMGGDVIKQQTEICRMIVLTKNRKYNSTVDYLLLVAAESKDIQDVQLQRILGVGSSNGALASNATETIRYGSSLQTSREIWESDMKQSDTQIAMLQQLQSTLARRAMNGQPSALGTLVNVTALKAAFTVKN